MSWLIAFAGFAALIILHEFGHFAVAKWVGMRVERFSLFFPPHIFKVKRGETEYAIGTLPFGGYVKITGMSPREEIPPEAADRAYFRQPPWKRIVVILAGPGMNVLIAFVILFTLFTAVGIPTPTTQVEKTEPSSPAAAALRPGDRIVAVDGRRATVARIPRLVGRHRCAGRLVKGCRAVTPVRLTIVRDGRRLSLSLRPFYDPQTKSMRVGFAFHFASKRTNPAHAASLSVTGMWSVTKKTLGVIVRIFEPKQRKQISGIVGSYEVTRQAVQIDAFDALTLLAFISLSLAIVNLFPFLPLDGGHVFWAVVEKVRRKPVPYEVMERSGVIGFMLIIFLFAIGLSNDISRLRGQGFGVR
jgi:regulator of sigma E protease